MPGRAILLAVTASFFFASSTYLAKLLGSGFWFEAVHPFQITHSRFVFGFLTGVLMFIATRSRFTRPNLKLHVLRSTMGWCGVTAGFVGVIYIPASDAIALIFLNPIFAMAFAVLILKEVVGRRRWSAAVVAFIGGVILIRPEGSSTHPVALLCLAGAVVVGLEIVIIKMLTSRESIFQILVISNAIAMVVASVPLAFVFEAPTSLQWTALVGVGVLMTTGQMLFLLSMRANDASLVAPFIYATLIFVVLLDLLVLGVVPDLVSFTGMTIIIASGCYIALREHRQRMKAA